MNGAFYSKYAPETQAICKCATDIWAYISDEDFVQESFSSLREFCDFFENAALLDLACIDITTDGAVPAAEKFRSKHMNSQLAIIADASIMPTVYIKPTIMASSLLLRPLDKAQVKEAIYDMLVAYNSQLNDDGFFSIKTTDGTIRLPYGDILYFEARDKKIFARVGCEEYSFYSTIEKLLIEVPNNFLRCHRSFLVNKGKIKRIDFPSNSIELVGENYVPLSRGYRSEVREWVKR